MSIVLYLADTEEWIVYRWASEMEIGEREYKVIIASFSFEDDAIAFAEMKNRIYSYFRYEVSRVEKPIVRNALGWGEE